MIRIIVLGDLHLGHNRALTPRSWFNEHTNDFQLWVIEQFESFIEEFRNPDILVLNGDLADGSQVKTLGVDAITTDFDLQAEMVKELLLPLLGENTKIFGINGSGYHGGKGQGITMDKRITEMLAGEFKGNIFHLEICQEKIQFAHGSGGGIINPDAYIRRELLLAQRNANKAKVRCPSILVRSHGHLYYVVGDSVATIYMTPCWQYPTTYMEMKTANMLPDIGGLVIEMDEDITKVYPKLYPIPPEIIESMTHLEAIKTDKEIEEKRKIRAEKIAALRRDI